MPENKFFSLQLFGDEEGASVVSGDADTTAGNAGSEGVATGGEAEQPATAPADQGGEDSFESLIKGKYKKEYGEAVKAAVSKRMRNQHNLQQQINSIDPIVRAVAQRYGIAPNPDGSIPIDALNAAIQNDNSAFEKEAFDRGISVEEVKRIHAVESENARYRSMMQEAERESKWNDLTQQAERLKADLYPDLDLSVEMDNPQFVDMVRTFQNSGFKDAVKIAYEAVHRDEIMSGMMEYAIKRTKEETSRAIQSGKARPVENGVSGQSAVSVGGIDPSKLTPAQIKDYISRAERGESITLE